MRYTNLNCCRNQITTYHWPTRPALFVVCCCTYNGRWWPSPPELDISKTFREQAEIVKLAQMYTQHTTHNTQFGIGVCRVLRGIGTHKHTHDPKWIFGTECNCGFRMHYVYGYSRSLSLSFMFERAINNPISHWTRGTNQSASATVGEKDRIPRHQKTVAL